MKTFLRKLKLSFLAMLCGWIACNIAWWVAMLAEVHFDEIRIQDDVMKVLFLGAATGIVILAAWLVIFLPVDLLIPDHSKLRRPWPASICGLLAGSSVMVIIWGTAFFREGSAMNSSELFTWQAFFLMSSPGITGMVAAYVRSRDRKLLLN
ncbi:hypothetical protein [Prosthecobacter sp.]|uniref:hypothetical protein n=1 Tax=Prosthecobacter sp. TaxID=1965333 RepID=UPI0024894DA1|nr:hypothetical protein [Prosthecobacter sp.]MDI1312768.1 hypothetical protein [Prosthecobacter sp.]